MKLPAALLFEMTRCRLVGGNVAEWGAVRCGHFSLRTSYNVPFCRIRRFRVCVPVPQLYLHVGLFTYVPVPLSIIILNLVWLYCTAVRTVPGCPSPVLQYRYCLKFRETIENSYTYPVLGVMFGTTYKFSFVSNGCVN